MLATVLAPIMPQPASTPIDPADPESTPLRRLAQRIARNREVLGLHYPSDSKAGKHLGETAAPLLAQCPSAAKLIAAAELEWS